MAQFCPCSRCSMGEIACYTQVDCSRGIDMKLSSCPKCGTSQKFKSLLTLTVFNEKVCHNCGGYYTLSFKRNAIFAVLTTGPLLVVHLLTIRVSGYIAVLLLLWLVIMASAYFKYAPLVEIDI